MPIDTTLHDKLANKSVRTVDRIDVLEAWASQQFASSNQQQEVLRCKIAEEIKHGANVGWTRFPSPTDRAT